MFNIDFYFFLSEMPAQREMAVGRSKLAYKLFNIIFLAWGAWNKLNQLFAQMFVVRNIYFLHGYRWKMNRAVVSWSSKLWPVTCRKSINNS